MRKGNLTQLFLNRLGDMLVAMAKTGHRSISKVQIGLAIGIIQINTVAVRHLTWRGLRVAGENVGRHEEIPLALREGIAATNLAIWSALLTANLPSSP